MKNEIKSIEQKLQNVWTLFSDPKLDLIARLDTKCVPQIIKGMQVAATADDDSMQRVRDFFFGIWCTDVLACHQTSYLFVSGLRLSVSDHGHGYGR